MKHLKYLQLKNYLNSINVNKYINYNLNMKNSKSSVNNTGFTGINYTKGGRQFNARVSIYVRKRDGKIVTKDVHISTWNTLKKAKKARLKFIKSLL